jgi:hypothetical protein
MITIRVEPCSGTGDAMRGMTKVRVLGFPEKSSPFQPIVMMPGRKCECRRTNTEKEL